MLADLTFVAGLTHLAMTVLMITYSWQSVMNRHWPASVISSVGLIYVLSGIYLAVMAVFI